MLGSSPHHHHIPIYQLELLNGGVVDPVVDMSEEEIACGAEGEGCYTWVGAEEGFRVGVVGDGIGAVGVVVDEGEVVGFAGDLLDWV